MPPSLDQAKVQQALHALGVTPQALELIRRSPFEDAKRQLAQLKVASKKQYRRLALELHPDRTSGDKIKEELFKLVDRVHQDFQKLEVRPPAPRPVWIRIVGAPVWGPVSATTTTTTTTASQNTTTWASWSSGGGTTNVSTPQPRQNARHVVNMRP